jgi:hypothetical protein
VRAKTLGTGAALLGAFRPGNARPPKSGSTASRSGSIRSRNAQTIFSRAIDRERLNRNWIQIRFA